jgi:outer membrane receptor for ferrienterochelin and colicin
VNYKYSNNVSYEYVSAEDSLEIYSGMYDANKSVDGTQLGLFLSGRFQIASPFVVETGMRYDYVSYSEDKLWSPRINLVYSLSKNSFFRAGWGYYYQSQTIDQLEIQYKVYDYYSASLSKQYVLGYEHFFDNGLHFRAEGYYKDIINLPDAYYTFANIDEFFPEAREDLFKVSIEKAKATGIEFYLKYDTGNKISWWLSYVFSEAKEYYTDIQYSGKLTRELGWQSRPWDQRHTVNADVNYRLNNKWHFNLTWQYHSGWPYTPFEVKSKVREDGTYAFYHEYGTLNGKTYPSYHRMDVRINRYFYPSCGIITTFLHIINLYNQENIYNYDHDIINPYSENYKVEIVKETWFGFTPFAGVSWEF